MKRFILLAALAAAVSINMGCMTRSVMERYGVQGDAYARDNDGQIVGMNLISPSLGVAFGKAPWQTVGAVIGDTVTIGGGVTAVALGIQALTEDDEPKQVNYNITAGEGDVIIGNSGTTSGSQDSHDMMVAE